MRDTNGRFIPLDAFSAVCCLAVVMIHVLSLGITQGDPASPLMAPVYLVWTAVRFSVPGFLAAGGAKVGLAHRAGDYRPYGAYLRRRARRVYLPYLGWTVIYYLCFLPIGYVEGGVKELLYYLWMGNLSAQFYYVLVTMQLYLLRPVWHWMLERIPWQVGILATAALTWGAQLTQARAAQLLPWLAPYQDRIFVPYLLYWVAGLYAGDGGWLERGRGGWGLSALEGGVVCSYLLLAYTQFFTGEVWLDLELVKPIFSLNAVHLVYRACKRGIEYPRIRGFLARVHWASLFIFFSHCLVLTVGTAVLRRMGITGLSQLLPARMVMAYGLPWAGYWLLWGGKEADSKTRPRP